MRWRSFVALAVGLVACTGSRQSMQSADSSGRSANSSASAGSSDDSAASSNDSAASSNASANSSRASNESSQSSQNSNQSSNASSNSGTSQSSQATSQSSQASWSQVAVASALLSAVGGGITTTVYASRWKREARLKDEELKKLQLQQQQQQQPQQPLQPLPYPGPSQPLPPPLIPPPPPPPPVTAPPPPPPPTGVMREVPFDAMVQARAWLIANELQFKQDLALGAGPTLVDLAGVAGIAPERRAHFGRLLQRNRARFQVPSELTPEQAATVFAEVGELVMNDPLLRPDGLKVIAAW